VKKIILLTSTIVCSSFVINASEANRLGQQVIRELGDNVKRANLVFRAAVSENERQDALKNAHEAAKTLLNTLNDVKTYGNETIKGYNAAQRKHAAITLAELLTRENSLKIEIENKKMEIADMTDIGYILNSPKKGKAEQHAQAKKEKKALGIELNNIRQAIRDQEMILKQDWSNTIRLAIQNLIVGSSYGIAYGIDWYFGDHGAKLLTEENNKPQAMNREPKMKRSMPLTNKQKAAIKSWHHLRKSELLSKEITTAYQLAQAKELLIKLNNIKDDLKNVSVKHKYILDKVTENADSLARKIDRAKTRWLK
jgi:hypothetical protein